MLCIFFNNIIFMCGGRLFLLFIIIFIKICEKVWDHIVDFMD